MKKTIYCIFAFLLTLSLLAVSVPGKVSASAGDIGSGTWVTPGSSVSFTTTNVDKAAQSAPKFLQQLSEGIVLSAPAKICYPFRGGQYHWEPKIMKLYDGSWTGMTTDKENVYTDEAVEYACTKALEAGTYALFGYYDGPVEPKSTGLSECGADMEFTGEYYNSYDESDPDVSFWLDTVPASLDGKDFTYEILSVSSNDPVTLSPMTGDFWYNSYIDQYNREVSRDGDINVTGMTIRVTTPSCYKDVVLTESLG